MDVFEPSEIIIDQEPVQASSLRGHPWVRFIARSIDYALFFFFLFILRKIFKGTPPFGFLEELVPFEFFVWIPFEALWLSLWGTTPGKWFLRMHLQEKRRQKLDFSTSLRRSAAVWVRGIGLGIPVLNGICMLFAFYRLNLTQTTSWDKEFHIRVNHKPLPRWRFIVGSIVGVGGVFIYFSLKNGKLW